MNLEQGHSGLVTPQRSRLLSLDWYRTLRGSSRHAFWAAFLGYALDAFDYQIFSFVLTATAAAFGLTTGQSGLIATVTLVVSAFGGILAGVFADLIGRVRTLMLTIAVYSLFTFLSGLAPNYGFLLLFRSLQGLGFGGEWAAGAILIAEVADPAQRGRVLGMVQSSWAVGWGLALVAYTLVFSFFPVSIAWRISFCLGILPGLLTLYVRSRVPEPEVFVQTRAAEQQAAGDRMPSTRSSLLQIFQPDLLGRTLPATLLAIGAQGGYYAIFTWLPTFLKTVRHLSVVGSAPYLAVVIIGSFVGYVTSGYINDWLGRRPTFAIYAICSAALIFLYTQIPSGANGLLLVLGAPLGFFASGIFSGFGSFLAEIFPSRARGAGQGFCYNFGRGVGAFFPTIIGFLSGAIGLGGAIGFGACAYALCLIALLLLPETRGKRLVAVD
ncbi:MAG: MFS transporter [Thermogemmatispora sp.]|jgi:MFS family permease|uniref:MFS transporter n=1 Tax=Thermogemmatispora aurantia TaxID=2045279 RepID=A0A5J4KB97_9CHLR|nr:MULTISPECIES: MFS transporter [Thermogemmatispora]MBE3565969.1 MFS transporter [Thermogemmatispora sp.]MBX5459146.1 MFS transporter [Thermogemmatispora sp.]GER84019.1 MFS transporter [Thermogemmatispora aurantia]